MKNETENKTAKVITYQSPNGGVVHLTRKQITRLRSGPHWPRDYQGAEYCTVSHGLHTGTPTYSAWEIEEIRAGA